MSGSKKITVELEVSYHPPRNVAKYKVNCYEYEVLLICWESEGEQAVPFPKRSQWMSLTEGLSDIDFVFDRPDDTAEWLVCLKQRVGFNRELIPSFSGEGMRIISAGTFNENDIGLFEKRKEEKIETAKAERSAAKRAEEQVERVKAKRKRPL